MYHTPQMSQAFLTLINTLSNVKLTDCSYKNDIMDAATNEEAGVTVYFPNNADPFTTPDGDEKVSYFSVRFGDEEYIDHGFTCLEVIALLNSFDRVIEFKEIDDVAVAEQITMLKYLQDNHDGWDSVISPVICLAEAGDYCNVYGSSGVRFEIERIS